MLKIQNSKQMMKTENNTKYDLEERTLDFAKEARVLIKELPKTTTNFEDAKQLTRSSGSIAANYIEANEALSKKDFLMRIKICRKEAKETILWLKLIGIDSNDLNKLREKLIVEATELMKIMSAIMRKSE